MPRYQLKKNVVFVEAKDKDGKPLPAGLPFPHIMDKRNESAPEYLQLNPAAAYITHFIAIGVSTDLIPGILRSEFGNQVADPEAEVDNVLNNLLKDYLEPRRGQKPYASAGIVDKKPHSGKYDLDFGINGIWSTWVKVPTS